FTSDGTVNAPWGMVLAPDGFGDLSNHLLVGNLGDGMINAFNVSDGSHAGALLLNGSPFAHHGLWGLSFGNPVSGPDIGKRLYFAAGIEDETHGLFGFLEAARETTPPPPQVCENGSKGMGFWSQVCGKHGHGEGDGDDDEHDDGIRGVTASVFGGHGPHSIPSDSLNSLFACVASENAAF